MLWFVHDTCSLLLLPPHTFALNQREVPPTGYSPSQTAPANLLLHGFLIMGYSCCQEPSPASAFYRWLTLKRFIFRPWRTAYRHKQGSDWCFTGCREPVKVTCDLFPAVSSTPRWDKGGIKFSNLNTKILVRL